MKKILAYITPEKQAGFFDLVVGYDSDADIIVPYTHVEVSDVKDVIYGAVFTRHPRDLRKTAIFIGGHDFEKCLQLLDEAKRVFKTLPENFRVSVALDPDGACTTAASCVAKIKNSLELSGRKVVVLAGTGPVGQSIAVFLARQEKARVTITSRRLEKAQEITKKLRDRYRINVTPLQGSTPEEIAVAIKDADVVISTGPEGVVMLPQEDWSRFPQIKILADVNAVPPAGIEGVEPLDDGRERHGKVCFGAIDIGNLKINVHHQLIKKLFQAQETFALEKIYQLTLEILDK